MFKVPEKFRVTGGTTPQAKQFATTIEDGNNGLFLFIDEPPGDTIRCVASDGGGWEHVSVSMESTCIPDWNVMCFVKNTFWGPEDYVVQYHPPSSVYINNNAGCLHLWRPINEKLPIPPSWMVGSKRLGTMK